MKQRTRLMALLLALILLLQCLPSTAFAAAPELLASVGEVLTPSAEAEDLAWTLEDGVLTITGTGDMPTWDSNGAPWYASRSEIIEICVIEGLTSIGPWAFHDCHNLTSITLPESITSIGNWAFQYCRSLPEIVIPEGVTRIEGNAFANCEALVSVTLPDTLTEIGNQAFVQCDALRSIVLPDSVTTLGAAVFDNCNALTEVTLPAGLTALPYQTFLNCTSLQTVVLPDGITAIHYEAFHNCHALGGLVLPDGVTTIGNSAFQNCSALTALELPAGVTSLGSNAFDGCTALAALELPEGLTTIGSVAFKNCDSITEFVIPDSVTAIGSWAFESCDSLTAVKLSAGLTELSSNLFFRCPVLPTVEIPDSVTSIGELAFYDCDGLTEIVIPDSVTTLGKKVFGDCDSLTQVTLSASLTTIPEEAFCDCEVLTEIVIPEGVTSIDLRSFIYCDKLTTVSLPSTLTEIGQGAFSGCTSLTALELPEGLATIATEAFRDCDGLTKLILPETLTTIGSWTFHLMDGLTTIVLPDSVTSMGDNVFNGCKNLSDVTLGAGLTAIPEGTFRTCPALLRLEIPGNITSIGSYAFQDSGLAAIDIPDSVTAIGQSAFYQCGSLTDIVIPDTVTSLGRSIFYGSGLVSVTLGSGVTEVPGSMFYGCFDLEHVILPDNLTAIGYDSFRSCTSLTEIALPSALTSLDYGAFQSCDSLVSIELPEGFVSIGSVAFNDCAALESIVLSETLTTIGSVAFQDCVSLDGIVLPDGLTSLGRSAFSGCKALTGIVIPDSVTSMDIEVFENCTSLAQAEWNSTLTTIPAETFRGCAALASFGIPDTVTCIEASAFYGSGLKGIEIPATVTRIDDCAFAASALEEVTLPATVTTLGEEVFNGCNRLTKAVVAEGITQLPTHTFSYCGALKDVTLSEGLTALGTCVFEYCTSLTHIELPSTLTTIGNSCFSNCDALESIVIPDGVTTIMDQAFRDCNALTTVELNEGLTTLGSYAFYYCGSLTDIVIPNSVTRIEMDTFSYCPNLEWVWIPPTVTAIDGAAFRSWKKLTIRGVQGSYAETYANNKGIPFEHALNPGVRLTLSVTDPEGAAISGGYTVEWYQGDELVATGASLHADDLTQGYSYQVFLGEKLGMTYVQPERQQVPADCSGSLTLALQPIERRALTGRVADPQGNGIVAELTVTQSYPGGGTKELTAETDEQGFYSLTIDNVHTEAMIRAEGYFTNQQTLLAEPTDTQTVIAANAVLYPLPQGSRIELTVSASTAVREGEEPALVTHSGAGLKYALFNETRHAAMNASTFQNGTLYFSAEQASEGDVLVLTVTDPAGLYQAPDVRVTLEANGIGSADVLLVENGSIRIDAFTGVSAARVMLFDSTDRLLEVRSVSGSYESPVLADGSYQLLLLEENGYIHSVSSPDELTALGLTEGADYALLTADVHNGVITVLSGVAVPVLDTAGLCSTDPGKTWMQLSLSKAPVGQYVQVRLSYALNDDVDSADQTVQITLPDGVELYDGGMYLGSESIACTQSGNAVTVSTGLDEAVLYFYVMPTQIGTHALNAALSYTSGAAQRREPIGSAALTVEEASITAPERTKRETFPVTGKALPGSTVKIYEGQTLLGQTTANTAGTWKIEVSPINLFTLQTHDIYAVIEHSDLPAPVATAVSSVLYDIHYVELDRVLMHTSRGTFTFSYTDPKPVYSYMTEHDYTFEVIFDGNVQQLYDVTLTVYCLSGKTVTVPVTYLEESGKWSVSVSLSHADAPVNVGVGYACLYGEDYGDGLGWTEEGFSHLSDDIDAMNSAIRSLLNVEQVSDNDLEDNEETYNIYLEGIGECPYTVVYNEELPDSLEFTDYQVPGQTEPVSAAIAFTDDAYIFYARDQKTGTTLSVSVASSFSDVSYDGVAPADTTLEERFNNWLINYLIEEHIPVEDFNNSSDALKAARDLRMHYRTLELLHEDTMRKIGELYREANATCPNGSMKYDPQTRSRLQQEADKANMMEMAFYRGHQDSLRNYSKAVRNNLLLELYNQSMGMIVDAAVGRLLAGISAVQEVLGVDLGMKKRAKSPDERLREERFDMLTKSIPEALLRSHEEMDQMIRDSKKKLDIAIAGQCRSNPKPNPPSPVPDVTPVIDPAGFIYEAVESNRLEGVTVTAYYQDKNGNSVLWDAENYDQVNPLTTDSQGAYAWFVPMGMWQVKAEMPGYETAYSEWLPVPPPQMEVNIGLVSTAAPVVESARAFEDGVMVTFSQYMDIESVQKAMRLSVGSGIAQPVDEEAAPDGVTMYARRFLLPIPEGTADAVRVTVSAEARNYAGTPIAQSWTSEAMKPIAAPTEVNMREEYSLVIGDSLTVNVTLLPGLADRTLLVETSTPLFLSPSVSEIVTDEQGNASFTLSAMLPGVGYITVREPDSGLSASAKVHIRLTEAEEVAPVVVTLDDGTEAAESQAVPAGTKLTLTTATAGAQIRYTLDGSCPCRSGAIVYTEPLAITRDTRLMVAAVVDGVFGPISEYRFTIAKPENPFTDVPEGSFYYEPVLWAVKNGITNGTSPTTFGPNDQCMRAHVVTFLWRAVGSPEPGSDTNPFVDVKETDFYYKAVLWAVEQGITNGLDATHFGPFAYCNRAQVVTFLHRSLGSPAPTTTANPFTDVPAGQWYTAPVLWAVEHGVTKGLSATSFGPTAICNRAQIVTFLYRAIA